MLGFRIPSISLVRLGEGIGGADACGAENPNAGAEVDVC
jgi:hypothetical protein